MRRRLAALFAGALVLACGATALAAACGRGSQERAREEPVPEETTREERTREERTGEEAKEGPRERQRATYYGEELPGNPTASGEPYDPRGLTAAHKTLPFGTVLEVCYHGCVRVMINDRNPSSAADLDLSRAAADRIGLTPDGTGVVDTEVI